MIEEKCAVHDFWDSASCGEKLYLSDTNKEGFGIQSKTRYELEPYILRFVEFEECKDQKILEIGVGLGADHQKFAEQTQALYGIDLTARAVEHTRKRLQLFGLNSNLQVADAENLGFDNDFFDLIFSWGVLHHTPDTQRAVSEVFRVLKPGGTAKLMIYHKYSFVGYMLWVRYGLLKFNPFISLTEIYNKHLESPGTQAFSVEEAQKIFSQFKDVDIQIVLSHGDLLTSNAGQRHRGIFLKLAKIFWPRWLIKTFFKSHGLFMLIKATK